jgi:hypothetical protein
LGQVVVEGEGGLDVARVEKVEFGLPNEGLTGGHAEFVTGHALGFEYHEEFGKQEGMVGGHAEFQMARMAGTMVVQIAARDARIPIHLGRRTHERIIQSPRQGRP